MGRQLIPAEDRTLADLFSRQTIDGRVAEIRMGGTATHLVFLRHLR